MGSMYYMSSTETTSKSEQSPTVAIVDVDGVLYDYDGNMAEIAQTMTGRPAHHFPTAEDWDYKGAWNITPEEFVELVHVGVAEHGFGLVGRPLPGSQAGMAELRTCVDRIHIVTAFGSGRTEDLAHLNRAIWLNEWGFEYDELTFTSKKGAVVTQYLELGWKVYALEDYEGNFRALEDAGATSFLQHQRWNRHVETELRVRDVEEFALRIAELRAK